MINIYNFIIHDYFFLGPVVLFGPVAGPVVVLGFVEVLGLTGPVVGPEPGPDVAAVVVCFINYLIFLNFLLL
jgi:hypothetical protein